MLFKNFTNIHTVCTASLQGYRWWVVREEASLFKETALRKKWFACLGDLSVGSFINTFPIGSAVVSFFILVPCRTRRESKFLQAMLPTAGWRDAIILSYVKRHSRTKYLQRFCEEGAGKKDSSTSDLKESARSPTEITVLLLINSGARVLAPF